jgi:hypothetical protein
MTNQKNRIALWTAMLDADYQKRYWHRKAGKFTYWDRRIQVVLALSSSAAVFTALSDLEYIALWKILTFITALIAVAWPFFNLGHRSFEMHELSNLYHGLEIHYESLWRKVDDSSFTDSEFHEQFDALKAKELVIGKKIFDLPTDDKKLHLLCQKEVVNSRGLERNA